MRFTASSAIGGTGAAPGLRRALAAMSASSKKPRWAFDQQSADVTGPPGRAGSYSPF